MELFGNVTQSITSFIVILSVIVFVHEFGHYIVAKWCGVKIDAFSIGFGKELFGFTDRSGTRWKFSVLPLGGYVKMFGDASEASTPDNDRLESLSEAEKKLTFHHKPLWKKFLVVAAGPVANFLLCIGILTYFIAANGMESVEPIIGEVLPNTPAAKAGFQKDDYILSMDGEAVDTFSDIQMAVAINVGKPIEFLVLRADKYKDSMHIKIVATPQMVKDKDAFGNAVEMPRMGLQSKKLEWKELGVVDSLWEATKRTYNICHASLKAIGQIIVGDRGLEGMKGPVGIAKLSGQAVEQSYTTVLWFIAMLSANLGLMNLLPVPMLDGGHIAYYIAEAIRGRPLAQKVQEMGFRIGFALLIMLMVFTLYNDVIGLFA